MGSFSIWHWLVVLGIVVLVFGTKRLKNLGGDLGGAIKGFKSAMREGEAEAAKTPEQLAAQQRNASEGTASQAASHDKTQV